MARAISSGLTNVGSKVMVPRFMARLISDVRTPSRANAAFSARATHPAQDMPVILIETRFSGLEVPSTAVLQHSSKL
jgi:hypothetical protein